MKKILALTMAMLLSFSAFACSTADTSTSPSLDADTSADAAESDSPSSEPAEDTETKTGSDVKVTLLIAGNLGDMSFNDSAAEGVKTMKEKLGVQTQIIECNADVSKYEPTLLDAADSGANVVIVTTDFVEYLVSHAESYPDVTFIMFDDSIDYTLGNLSNVHSILYKNNEGAFLGGFLASELTKSGEPYNDKKIVSFLGGMDVPVINDFLIGYIEGAQYADPETKVITTYANSWSDSAKGKELSISMINQGADIGFNVAGGAGTGLIEASVEKNAFVIGVDSDQAMAFKETKPEFSNIIPTSILKNIGFTLYQAVEKYLNGTLESGEAVTLGIADGAIGIAENEYFDKLVSAEIKEKLAAVQEKVVAGEIVINSAYGMPQDEVNAIREGARP